MPSAWIIWTVAKIILSFLLGAGVYFIVIQGEAKMKWQAIEDVFSFIINVILYMWLAKILLHLQMFIQDPFALLAYPSTRQAFYIGVALAVIHSVYKGWKKGEFSTALYDAFVPIFIFSSFIYEFMQLIERKSNYELPYVITLAVVLLYYVFIGAKMSASLRSYTTALLWLVGVFILQWIMPVVTMYQYRITIPFIVIVLLAHVGYGIIQKKRK